MKDVSLNDVFLYLKREDNYKIAVKRRVCKIILGSSVIRVFEENTKTDLINCLTEIDVSGLYTITSQKVYDAWHSAQTNFVYNALSKKNKDRFEDLAGLKWGHATKIFNLYIGHLIFYSPYFAETKYIKRLYNYVHVPLDSKVFEVLRAAGMKAPERIKNMTKDQYYEIQDQFRKSAKQHSVPPLFIDEYAWAIS